MSNNTESRFTRLRDLAAQRLGDKKQVTLKNSTGQRIKLSLVEENTLKIEVMPRESNVVRITQTYCIFTNDSFATTVRCTAPTLVEHELVKFNSKSQLFDPGIDLEKWSNSIRLLCSYLSQQDYVPIPDASSQ